MSDELPDEMRAAVDSMLSAKRLADGLLRDPDVRREILMLRAEALAKPVLGPAGDRAPTEIPADLPGIACLTDDSGAYYVRLMVCANLGDLPFWMLSAGYTDRPAPDASGEVSFGECIPLAEMVEPQLERLAAIAAAISTEVGTGPVALHKGLRAVVTRRMLSEVEAVGLPEDFRHQIAP